MKSICILLFVICLITAVIVGAAIVSADASDDLPRQPVAIAAPYFNMATCLKKMPDSNAWVFDYPKYLDSADTRNVASIKQQLASMDSITVDSNFNRRTLSTAITRELLQRSAKTNTSYQPDSLLSIIQWAEQFQYAADFDPANHLFYRSIYDFWLDQVSGALASYSVQQPAIRHHFKFKYLITRCKEKNYSIPVKVTSGEKLIDNMLYSNWGHLIHATWTQSTWWLKLSLLIVFALIGIGITAVVKKINHLIKRPH